MDIMDHLDVLVVFMIVAAIVSILIAIVSIYKIKKTHDEHLINQKHIIENLSIQNKKYTHILNNKKCPVCGGSLTDREDEL